MKRLLFLLVLLSVAVFSCKKTDTTEPEVKDTFNASSNVTASTDNSIASIMFDDVYKQVENSSSCMNDSCHGNKAIHDIYTCAIITLGAGEFDTVTWPKHITVDFGSGCTDQYGTTRIGKIIYTASNWMHRVGSVCTVTTDGYYVNGYKIDGHKTITNQGLNSSQHLCFHVVVTDGVITHPTGEHHTWATDRVTEWISGGTSLFDPLDDKFSTTGSANGVTTAGDAYTITINSGHPLITEWTCRYIEQGAITIVVGTQPSITVDYGNGVCDANASFTIYGITYNFTMP
jgi:hypothetical protein